MTYQETEDFLQSTYNNGYNQQTKFSFDTINMDHSSLNYDLFNYFFKNLNDKEYNHIKSLIDNDSCYITGSLATELMKKKINSEHQIFSNDVDVFKTIPLRKHEIDSFFVNISVQDLTSNQKKKLHSIYSYVKMINHLTDVVWSLYRSSVYKKAKKDYDILQGDPEKTSSVSFLLRTTFDDFRSKAESLNNEFKNCKTFKNIFANDISEVFETLNTNFLNSYGEVNHDPKINPVSFEASSLFFFSTHKLKIPIDGNERYFELNITYQVLNLLTKSRGNFRALRLKKNKEIRSRTLNVRFHSDDRSSFNIANNAVCLDMISAEKRKDLDEILEAPDVEKFVFHLFGKTYTSKVISKVLKNTVERKIFEGMLFRVYYPKNENASIAFNEDLLYSFGLNLNEIKVFQNLQHIDYQLNILNKLFQRPDILFFNHTTGLRNTLYGCQNDIKKLFNYLERDTVTELYFFGKFASILNELESKYIYIQKILENDLRNRNQEKSERIKRVIKRSLASYILQSKEKKKELYGIQKTKEILKESKILN